MERSSLQHRLAFLLETVFAGNTLAAAREGNVQQSTIHRLISGAVESPRRSTVERLATAFGVPVGWLFGQQSNLAAEWHGLPIWYALILAFNAARQREMREWLRRASSENREARQLILDYREFHLLGKPGEIIAPDATLLFGSQGPRHAKIAGLRALGDAETALLLLAIRRIASLGASPPAPVQRAQHPARTG